MSCLRACVCVFGGWEVRKVMDGCLVSKRNKFSFPLVLPYLSYACTNFPPGEVRWSEARQGEARWMRC